MASRRRPHIVHSIGALGVGGDSRALVSLAAEQSAWADVTILTSEGRTPPGEDGERVRRAGVEVLTDTASYFSAAAFDAAIFHRKGEASQHTTDRLRILVGRRIPAWEVNTFSRADPSTDGLWAGHFHPSRYSLVQYLRRRGWSTPPGDHHPLGHGIRHSEPATPAEVQAARRELGLDHREVVAVRVVRPDLRKWSWRTVLAVRGAPSVSRLIILGCPPSRERGVTRALGQRALLIPPTSDDAVRRRALAAADVVINCSNIGETFGVALAEGMAVGLPALVDAGPRMDLGHLDLCLHQVTGLVCHSTAELSTSLEKLATDALLRSSLGRAAAAHIRENFSEAAVENRMRDVLSRHLEGVPDRRTSSGSWDMSDDSLRNIHFALHRAESAELEVGVRLWRARDAFDYGRQQGLAHSMARLRKGRGVR